MYFAFIVFIIITIIIIITQLVTRHKSITISDESQTREFVIMVSH